MRLAREIVAQFHSADAAEEANAGFDRTFRKRELPADVPAAELPFQEIADALLAGEWIRLSVWGQDAQQPMASITFGAFEQRLYQQRVANAPRSAVEEVDRHRQAISSGEGIVISLADVMQAKLELSRLEIQRLILQGAVDLDGQRIEGEFAFVKDGSIIRVGKHRFLRIVDADKHP